MIILLIQGMLLKSKDMRGLSKATEMADRYLDKNLAHNNYSIILYLVND